MKDIIVSPKITLRESLKKISQTGEKCLFINDKNGKLLGTLSDGDIRKSILESFDLEESIEKIINKRPFYLVKNKFKISEVKKIFLKKKFDIIPIVLESGKIVDAITWDDVFRQKKETKRQSLKIPAVIMSGGKGTRLEPFTKILPKPLLPINNRAVIERIIDKFLDYGVEDFFLTLNFKSLILKAFFEELNPNYSINFVKEKNPLGTAGGLSLLKDKLKETFFLTNCDIIINANYVDFYNFHKENKFDLTLVASTKEYTFPYGNCKLNKNGSLDKIDEKPKYDFLINTGFYILEPKIINHIPKNKRYDITTLIEDLKKAKAKIGVYPIDDDCWLDVGHWAEYNKTLNNI